MAKIPWTVKEVQFVRDNYPSMTDDELAEVLGRTKSSIRGMRNRNNIKYEPKFALYKGDDLQLVGTREEIMKFRNIKLKTFYYYLCPAPSERCNGGNYTKIVRIE